jgi:hypothetical protein
VGHVQTATATTPRHLYAPATHYLDYSTGSTSQPAAMVQLRAALVFVACAVVAADAIPEVAERRLQTFFNLRLYWEQGYRWQESPSEKFWCLKCQNSGCTRGSGVKIARCSKDDWRQHFFFDDGRIRTRRNLDVCLERSGRSIVLKGCDSSDDQVWASLRKDKPFRLQIPGNDDKCATQHHHPKDGEKVFMASCKLASNSQTDKWIVY